MATQDEILTLSPLEHCRLRPGVYAGDTSNSNQLVLEVFANALDCYNAGYGNQINININDGIIQCEDYGQGFNVNELREDGATTLEAAFSIMNTSGKFSDDGLYQGTSLGLNGMGSKICTFLSHWLEVITFKNNESEHLWFKEGVLEKREVKQYKSAISGTTVTFQPSEEFFNNPNPDTKFLSNFFNDIACLCPGLKIRFNDTVIEHNGIEDLLTRKVGSSIEIINNRLIFNKTINKQNLNLGLTFTSNSNVNIIPYVNCGNTDTGPHITAIKSTITRIFNNWAKENGIIKANEKNLEGNNIQEGMILVCNITSPSAAYNAQVKTTITKIDTAFITSILSEQLELWLDNNPEDATNILEKALLARKAAEAAKKARARVKKEAEKKTKFAAMPSKLADCNCKNRTKAELYITEGDSASGGAKMIRNASTQAVMGLRGKVLNCLTAKPAAILKNAEIIDILKALGFDYEITSNNEKLKVIYDENKLRYGKFIIAADKDMDGCHIQCLILSMLWALIPEMILDGYVYIANPPLYKAEWGTQYKYLSDQEELEQFKQEHKGKYTLTYFKGLGEASAEELGWMIMNPETRDIRQVQVEDFGVADKVLTDLMGSDSTPKKKFVFGNKITEII